MDAMRLTVYGDWGLTPAVRKNLLTAAVLLLVLFVIDTVAWAGFWNLLINGSIRVISPVSSIAVLLGILIATGILFYESQFLSTNFRTSKKPWISIFIRFLSIIAIAFVTSLPIDLSLLDQTISERVHQEKVLQQVPILVRQWDEARQRVAGTSTASKAKMDALTVQPRDAVKVAQENRRQQQEAMTRIQSDRSSQQSQVRSLETRLASPGIEPADEARIRSLIGPARQRLAGLVKEENAAASRVAQALEAEHNATLGLEQTKADIRVSDADIGTVDQRRYENWVNDLWDAKPLQVVTERSNRRPVPTIPNLGIKRSGSNTGAIQATTQESPQQNDAPLEYDGPTIEGDVGIGERLIVLGDVLDGRPPRRPKMSEGDREVGAAMKLTPFIVGYDKEAVERQQIEAAQLRKLSLGTFIVFTIFPCMIMAVKALFDKETSDYFDSDEQRLNGNPEVRSRSNPVAVSEPDDHPDEAPRGSGRDEWMR